MIYLLFICSLFGQEMNIDNFSSNDGTTGSIGTVTINNEVYNQLSLRPEIPIGKLGIGLDVYLYFNDDGMYWDSWDFSSSPQPDKSHNVQKETTGQCQNVCECLL